MAKSSINEGFNRKSHLSMVDFSWFFQQAMFDDRFRGEWDFRESNLMENNSSLGFFWERWVVIFLVSMRLVSKRFSVRFLSWVVFAIKTIASFGWTNYQLSLDAHGILEHPESELQRFPKTLGGWRLCCNYMYRLCMIMLTKIHWGFQLVNPTINHNRLVSTIPKW